MDAALYFLVLTTISGVLALHDQRYCNVTSCGDSPHSGCIYSLNEFGEKCGKVLSMGLTANEIKEIVIAHNKFRQFVASGQEKRGKPGPQPPSENLKPLKWSHELATIAQLWANQCSGGHDKCRNIDDSWVGQNAAGWSIAGASRRGNVTFLVELWYEEVKDFNKDIVKSFRGTTGPAIGHYTQLVWGKTTHVGCGLSQYISDGKWTSTSLICNYAPGGNILTLPVY